MLERLREVAIPPSCSGQFRGSEGMAIREDNSEHGTWERSQSHRPAQGNSETVNHDGNSGDSGESQSHRPAQGNSEIAVGGWWCDLRGYVAIPPSCSGQFRGTTVVIFRSSEARVAIPPSCSGQFRGDRCPVPEMTLSQSHRPAQGNSEHAKLSRTDSPSQSHRPAQGNSEGSISNRPVLSDLQALRPLPSLQAIPARLSRPASAPPSFS